MEVSRILKRAPPSPPKLEASSRGPDPCFSNPNTPSNIGDGPVMPDFAIDAANRASLEVLANAQPFHMESSPALACRSVGEMVPAMLIAFMNSFLERPNNSDAAEVAENAPYATWSQPLVRSVAASQSLHWTSEAATTAVKRPRPLRWAAAPAARAAAMLSEGCAGSFERYVSLKSRYLTSMPFAKAACSGVVGFVEPRTVDAVPEDTSGATALAALAGGEPSPPGM